MLAHGAQDLATSESRSDGGAIRTGVRGRHESSVLSDLPEHIPDAAMPFFHSRPSGTFFFFWGAPITPRREPFPARHDRGGNTIPELVAGAIARRVHA